MTISPRPAGRVDAKRMERLLAPRSIAIVGASDDSGWSRYTYANLRTGGFPGEIYCVNPRRETAHGQRAYPSLGSLPEPVDLAYVLVGTDAVLPVMAQAADAGVANLAVVAAGFAEAGPDGQERQRQLTEFASAHGQLVFGPNNLGYINSPANVMAFSQPMPSPLPKGGVSLLSQSGALAIFAMEYLAARDVGLSCLLTMGNEAMINVAHGMEFLVEDPGTRVIALFLESVRQPEEFRRLATRALELGKPVVACKIGRSKLGARAAAAHTGALVGDDAVIDAALRQLGVIRVDSLEDLIITAGLLDSYGAIRGGRVGVVTASGAMCGVVSDIAEREGILLPDFSPATVDALQTGILPPFATAQNPLDLTGYTVVDPDLMHKAHDVIFDDPGLDVVVLTAGLPQSQEGLSELHDSALRRIADQTKTAHAQVVLTSHLMTDHTAFARTYRAGLGLPMTLPGVEKGLPALARAIWWSEKLRTASRPDAAEEPPAGPAQPAAGGAGSAAWPKGPARSTAGSASGVGSSAWSELRAREHITAAGVPVVPGELAVSADEAVAAAERLGYPVVLKAVSASLLHKTNIGAVALDLADADQVRDAFHRVAGAASAHVPDLEGVLVTAMRRGGLELIVGVVSDPLWGPVLAVGLGGIWVEILRDSAQRLLPVSRSEIRAMLDELQASALLYGARGQEPADLAALTDVIGRIGDAAVSLGDRLGALEVNPLRVAGTEVEALDVLVTWRD
jgi:acetate---CoA ligase (ADP-forming)